MDDHPSLIGWLIAGGGGTLIGSVITAFIQTLGSRGKDRADAADKSVSVASRMIDRLEKENDQMREALILITDALDEYLDDPANPDVRDKLRAAARKAKRAV